MTGVAYVVRELGQPFGSAKPSQTFQTALGAAEAMLEAAGSTEPVTVIAGQQERDLNQKELRRLGEAIGEARARRAQEAENERLAETLGLAPKP